MRSVVTSGVAFDGPPPASGLRVSVVVPVRNEAAGIGRTLAALAAQVDADGTAFDRRRYEVLVLANNCSDATAAQVRGFAAAHPDLALQVAEVTFADDLAHIGHARRVAMDAAGRRLGQAGSADGVIASTDGDTLVAPTWLAATLAEIDGGADAVGGRILTAHDAATDAGTARWLRLDTAYRLAREKLVCALDPDPADPWPRHHQHFCASLAVRAEAYAAVGGVPAVRYLEDEALVAALRRADRHVRHSPRVRVMTSGRQQGRVEVGLSWQLREWARDRQEAASLMVDDAADLVAQTLARRRLRALWQRRSGAVSAFEALASGWRLSAAWLAEHTAGAATFGALWADVDARREQPSRPQVPVREAIEALRRLIAAQARENTSSR